MSMERLDEGKETMQAAIDAMQRLLSGEKGVKLRGLPMYGFVTFCVCKADDEAAILLAGYQTHSCDHARMMCILSELVAKEVHHLEHGEDDDE